jgi:hypothetical protein
VSRSDRQTLLHHIPKLDILPDLCDYDRASRDDLITLLRVASHKLDELSKRPHTEQEVLPTVIWYETAILTIMYLASVETYELMDDVAFDAMRTANVSVINSYQDALLESLDSTPFEELGDHFVAFADGSTGFLIRRLKEMNE